MAQSNNNTTIKVSVDASGVQSGVNQLKASGAQANATMDAMAKRAAQVDAAMKEAAANGFELNARAAKRLVDQYNQLEATAGKTRLEILNQRAASSGVVNAFTAQAEAIKAASSATHSFTMDSTAARREMLVMAHEASQGSWSKLGGSLMVFGEATDALSKVMSPLGASLGIVAAAAALFGYKIISGAAAFDTLNKSAMLTNGYLGLTTGQLKLMSESLAGTSTPLKTVEEAMTGLVRSGQISGEMLADVTRATVNFAHDTGEEVDKVVETMVKFSKDPKKALEELQGQYHLFTAAQAQVIEGYIRAGDEAAAYKAVVDGLNASHDRFKTNAEANIGYIGKLWRGLSKLATDMGNDLAHAGVQATDAEKLNDALKRQAGLKIAVAQLDKNGNSDAFGYRDKLKQANDDVAALQKTTAAQKAAAAAQADIARKGDGVVAANTYLDSTKYASPTRQRDQEIQAENVAYQKAIKDLDASGTEREQVEKRHQENLAQIRSQYAKKTTSDNGNNAVLARLRGENQLTEAEEKRSAAVLKGLRDANLIDADEYFRRLHDIQASALDQEIKNAATQIDIAKRKKEKAAAETAQAEYEKLVVQRKKVDDDLTSALATNAAKRAADIKKYQDDQTDRVVKQQRGYQQEDKSRYLSPTDNKTYQESLRLYEQNQQDLASLRDKYSKHQIDSTEYDAEVTAAQSAYNQETALLQQHLDNELAVRNSYTAQVKLANRDILGDGTTSAEAVGQAYRSTWDTATSALETALTTGKFSFSSFTASILQDLTKILLKWSEMSALQAFLGAGSGSSGTSALFGIASTVVGAVAGGSSGASSSVGSNTYGFHLATGGNVTGPGTSTSDSIPAMLSNGEYVINAKAASQHKNLLDAINYGGVGRFATGGAVGSIAPTASSGSVTHTTSLQLNLQQGNSGGGLTEQDVAALAPMFQNLIDKRLNQKMNGQGGYAYRIRHNQI
ncbi:phage tail length tape measure family protein [Robbsia andropogonis]|uniref:phage tail length tape measure family protein n=1 Tax=Robbsia andropogonis TaxID=28092 RepID=UPI002A6AA2DC|nr:phage tail length tape measure family protein [Robbsia andropogonis]